MLDDVLERGHVPTERALDAAIPVVVDARPPDGDAPAGGGLDALVGGAGDLRTVDDVGGIRRVLPGPLADAQRVAHRRSVHDRSLHPVAGRGGPDDRDRVELRGRRRSAAAGEDEAAKHVVAAVEPEEGQRPRAHRPHDATRIAGRVEGVDDDA